MHYIDVGQADSILIQLPDAKNILIDGGNNADGPAVIRYLKDQGVSRLDYIIATHPHEDHVGGLDAVIEAFDIGKVYAPRVDPHLSNL
ncbi:MBL fold metallo-hydrolase [Neomoorella thermoacetica]|uniref:MBL fold metallo-hydrolase n=1 Tax=Neomoorella thermoacetica TaxID=1525 RepID=UPI0008FB9A57